ncbi:MAG TPA: cation diffusion facilitator family transporter [Hyphomonadaceae bacterium]|nr:cation diffusion facilitator family transporter [Hyphomonadaceae bacterium]
MARSARKVVFAAGAANLAIALSKFVAFGFTGSSAMLTEAIHSLVDTGNQGLLLVGQARAAREPSATHQFGYGMEAFFWSFIVALMIFALGGAASVWEGLHQLSHAEPIRMPWVSFIVLGLAIVFEGLSFRVAWKEYQAIAGHSGFFTFLRGSKDPSLFAVLLEDGAALAGLLIALTGTSASAFLGWTYADGIASICIGLLLVAVAIFLANETRSLIAGEAASPAVQAKIRQIIAADSDISGVASIQSLHLGPDEILVAITLDFRDELSGPEIEEAADRLSKAVRGADPRITNVFLRPGKPASAASAA